MAIKRHSGEELDIKPYEADMRHLLNTYIQADPATLLGNLDDLPLVDAIVKSGIHDAIAQKLNAQGSLSRNAVAEGIINNLRKTIIREQLTDPRFYAEMSQLLDDLIRQARDDAASYAAWLQQAEALAKRWAQQGQGESIPAALHGNPAAITIYNNLPAILEQSASAAADQTKERSAEYSADRLRLTLAIDRTMREQAPAGWRGDETREAQVLNALFPLLNRDRAVTLAVFNILKHGAGYP